MPADLPTIGQPIALVPIGAAAIEEPAVPLAGASCGRHPDSEYVELAVEVFSMLADATRVRIILALREGELSVNRLAGLVEKSPAAVSQHLTKLRLARIVTTRQAGTRVFYRLANEHARQLVTDAIFQAEHTLGGTPRHHHPDGTAK